MDAETKKVLSSQEKLKSLTDHEGWPLARKIFTDTILSLQNAFDIETSDPQKMLIDLESRKKASALCFDVLRQIEGTASEVEDNKGLLEEDYVVHVQ